MGAASGKKKSSSLPWGTLVDYPPLPLASGPTKVSAWPGSVHCQWEVLLCTKSQKELQSSVLRYSDCDLDYWIGKDHSSLLRLTIWRAVPGVIRNEPLNCLNRMPQAIGSLQRRVSWLESGRLCLFFCLSVCLHLFAMLSMNILHHTEVVAVVECVP